jgi:hypothetical protein
MRLNMRSSSGLGVRTGFLAGIVVVVMTSFAAQRGVAGLFTLIDDNSLMNFNTASSTNASSWVVDGVNQLFQQAFWYRVGNTAEQSVHSLPIAIEFATNTNFDPNLDTLFVRYLGAGYHIDVRYSLDGGLPGSRASDMAEQISISNTGVAPLDFHFFQYADFDLNGTAGGDSAVFTNANAVQQSEGALSVSETVISPVPSHREIDTPPATLIKLSDGLPTTLSDTPATGNVFGPGDVAWAYQWDFLLPVGGTFQISKDKHLSGVPEPASALLISIGLGLAASGRRVR